MQPDPPSKDLQNADTKERLLSAGLEVFAARGFADASIRDICARARANPAAVHYHFGDKERFYAEVLVTCHRRAAQKRRMPDLTDRPNDPETVLHDWIRWMLDLLLVEASTSPLGALMAREIFSPTSAFDALIERSIAPMYDGLQAIVGALLGDDTDPLVVHRHTHSVLGQCLLYKHAQPALLRLHRLRVPDLPPPTDASPEILDDLARHIADVSIAGLARARARATEAPR